MGNSRKRPGQVGRAEGTRDRVGKSRGVSLSRIPWAPVRWEGGTVDLAALVELPPLAGPAQRAVLWVEAETRDIVGVGLAAAEEAPGSLAALLLNAIRQPEIGKPRRPAVVTVRDGSLEAPVRAVADPLGIQVTVDPELDALDDVVAELGNFLRARAPGRTYLAEPGVSAQTVHRMFVAARRFYASAPWHVLADDEPFELEIPGRPEPAFAVVLGAAGETYGLAIHFREEELAAVYRGTAGRRPPLQDVLALSFDPEDTVPPEMRQERRLYRWPLAGPVAFPVVYRSLATDELRGPNGAELELLTGVLDALSGLFENRRGELERRERIHEAVPWPPGTGPIAPTRGPLRLVDPERPADRASAGPMETGELRITFPSRFGLVSDPDRDDPRAAPGPVRVSEEEERRRKLLEDVDLRVTALPHALPTVARLAWSLFRSPEPDHTEILELFDGDEHDLVRRVMQNRFVEWAMFAVRLHGSGRTLAEQALDLAADELTPDALEERRRLINVRWSLFDVVGVQPDGVAVLRDRVKGDRVRVELGQELPEPGWVLTGTLFPIEGDRYMSGTLLPVPREQADELPHPLPSDPLELGPLLEAGLFGADGAWIDDLPDARAVRRVYEAFRREIGTCLPRYSKLEDRIREASSPAELLARLTSRVEFWSVGEVEVFVALVRRAWNLTPRRELGDRSPEEAHSGLWWVS